jgi:polysaccharide export outer membrane protein
MKLRYILFSIFAVFLFSCRSVPTDITYFQNYEEYVKTRNLNNDSQYELKIKSNDQLLIIVSSPVLDQTQVAQFNLPANAYLSPGESTTTLSQTLQTYLVDKNGYIFFPVIGKIQVGELTRSQAVELLTRKISEYLPEPIVNLQIVSFKITVLGEVRSPGPISVRNERMNIFEALGAAGDLTIYANRRNVILMRENNGSGEFHKLDLTQADILSSPYYYLQQNDVIYVEPNDTRKKESKYGAGESYTFSVISISFTAISVLMSLYGIFLK